MKPPGSFWNTGRQRKPLFWVNWRAVGMDPCVLCYRRLCPLAWPTTTVAWPVMRGSWWKRPIPQECSASSPAPQLSPLASTFPHAGLSRPIHLKAQVVKSNLFKYWKGFLIMCTSQGDSTVPICSCRVFKEKPVQTDGGQSRTSRYRCHGWEYPDPAGQRYKHGKEHRFLHIISYIISHIISYNATVYSPGQKTTVCTNGEMLQ